MAATQVTKIALTKLPDVVSFVHRKHHFYRGRPLMKPLLYSCLLSVVSLTSFAAAPQYKSRTDIASGFKQLIGLAVADFNGDGKPDFVIADGSDQRVVSYLNTGNGSFSSAIPTGLQLTAKNGVYTLVTGDFNEDGKQDLIVSTIFGQLTDVFLSGNGDGTFTQQPDLPGSIGFQDGVAVDINQDSHLDFIAGEGGLSIYLGDGHGNFQLKPLSSPGNYTGIAAADFDKDQKIDFVAASWLAPSDLQSFRGAGDGTFSGPNSLSNPLIQNPFKLATADFNSDGNADLLLSSLDAVFVIFGNGDGTFRLNSSDLHSVAFPNNHPPGGQNIPLVAAADADLDGKIDAFVANNASQTVNVVLNDGTGTFPQANPDFSATVDAGISNVSVADFNGDGLPDIILTSFATGMFLFSTPFAPR